MKKIGPKPHKVGSKNITKSMLDPKKRKKPSAKETKKPGTDLVIKSSPITAADKKVLKSYFEGHASKIMGMIEEGDADGGLMLLKRRLLLTTIKILPKAEEILNESGTTRGTYQFVTLVSQIRELIGDIQADQDRRYIARQILEEIIRPSMMNIAQDILEEHHEFRRRSQELVEPKNHAQFSQDMRELATSLARKMTGHYKEVEAKIIEALQT